MTDYKTERLRCHCCGKISEHSVLMSSNRSGSPDLDQRPPKMVRWTIGSWLKECPYCGYVAPDIDKGDAKARAAELTAEKLEYPFAEIVAFHRDKIAARDGERYTISQALEQKPAPPDPTPTHDPELIKALARHIKIVPSPRKTWP